MDRRDGACNRVPDRDPPPQAFRGLDDLCVRPARSDEREWMTPSSAGIAVCHQPCLDEPCLPVGATLVGFGVAHAAVQLRSSAVRYSESPWILLLQ